MIREKIILKIILEKLLSYGFVPEDLDEFLTSSSFSEEVIKNGRSIFKFQRKTKANYTQVKLTRNNNTPRYLGIINPYTYYNLCLKIIDSSKFLLPLDPETHTAKILHSKNSSLYPRLDNKNRRIFSILSDTGKYDEKLKINLESENAKINAQFGAKYKVFCDISNFYHSIYSHTIAWTRTNRTEAFTLRGNDGKWFNQIDQAIRLCQFQETIGIPIGPDTSAILAEYLLTSIDKNLNRFNYLRFVDDFYCYCSTMQEAEDFIAKLSAELEKFRLRLNSKKTKITTLPDPINPVWITATRLANKGSFKILSKQETYELLDILERAVSYSQRFPQDSPLKYVLKIAIKKEFTDFESFFTLLEYSLNLSLHHPYLIKCCEKLIEIGFQTFRNKKDKISKLVKNYINFLISLHAQYRRSDALAWTIQIANKYSLKISKEKIKKILMANDCLSTTLAYAYSRKQNYKIEFPKPDSDGTWWLYEYEKNRIEGKKFSVQPGNDNEQLAIFLNHLLKKKISFLKL